MPSSRFLPPVLAVDSAERSASLLQQGNLLTAAFMLDDAEPLLRQALALAPANAGALLGMANFYERRGTDPAAQMDLAFRALMVRQDNPAAHKLFALACRAHGLEPLAVGHLKRCIELAPHDSNAYFHLGLTLLQFGHWEEGWRTYEQRPTTDAANGYTKPMPPGTREWQGQNLRGKKIVLLGEDGHGDQIQNMRFARKVLALEPRELMLDVRPALRRLFVHGLSHLPGGDVVSATSLSEAGPAIDYVLAFGSMGSRFGANADSLSEEIPYLRSAVEPRFRPIAPVRIGIAWRGSPALGSDRLRSIGLSNFIHMLKRSEGIQWVSLQQGDYQPEEQVILRDHCVETPVRADFDFLDTAAVVADLDLTITVDTSIAHLAGALGKPVWLLNRATSEWRWGWKAATSPWYPTMRVFNQDRLLDWTQVLRDMRQNLFSLL